MSEEGEKIFIEYNNQVEELRAELLEYEELAVLDALIANNVVDPKTGMLTDYWLGILSPNLS